MSATAAAAPVRVGVSRAAPAGVPGDPARTRRATLAVVAGSVLLALALRLPFFSVPLGLDEGGLSFIAKQWGSGHGSLYGAYWLDRPPFLVGLFDLAVQGGPTGVRVLGCVGAVLLVCVAAALANAVAGHRAARVTAVLTAAFSGSYALGAVYAPSELLAAVPAAGSIACLVAARRSGRARWLVGAGALAMTAPLIKQSFLDAGAAGAVFVSASTVARPSSLPRNAAAYVAGAAIPCAALAVLLAAAHMSAHGLAYALFGFRVDALRTLAASNLPLQARVTGLRDPVLGSGMALALAAVPFGLWALRGDRVLAVTLGAWVAAGAVGVLGGGSYWAHYLIQLAVPAAVLAGAALHRRPAPLRALAAAAVAAVAIGVTAAGVAVVHRTPPRARAVALARYVRTHARPGDTQYVMYAHANVDFYSGLQSPYPYAWSLMDRAVPGAIPRLRHLLAGPDRPTWVVGWNAPSKWGLDANGRTKRLLHTRYVRVAVVGHHPIYLRTDRAAARHVAADTRRSPA